MVMCIVLTALRQSSRPGDNGIEHVYVRFALRSHVAQCAQGYLEGRNVYCGITDPIVN